MDQQVGVAADGGGEVGVVPQRQAKVPRPAAAEPRRVACRTAGSSYCDTGDASRGADSFHS